MIILGIYALFSILYTIYVKTGKLESMKRCKRNIKVFVYRFKHNFSKELSLQLKDINTYHKLLYIDSRKRFLILAVVLSLVYIMMVPPNQNKILQFFAILSLFTIFYGIGVYMNYSPKDVFHSYMIYGLKIIIILSYSLGFLVNYLEFGENMLLLYSSLLFPLIYSFILMKNVMDYFTPILFQLFNFICILGMVLFFLGLAFGSYYLHNNEIYQLFSPQEVNQIMNKGDINQVIFMVYKGLSPFYSFPSSINIENPLTYVPFIEFIVGYIFNAAFVGFFISYLVSKLINREQEKAIQGS
jgi:hypothetical protein